MRFDDSQLREILLSGGYISEIDAKKADEYSQSHKLSFLEYLKNHGIINSDLLGQALSEYYGVPYFNLELHQPSDTLMFLVPEGVARKYHIIVIENDDSTVTVTTDNPKQPEISVVLKKLFPSKKAKLCFSLTEHIVNLLFLYRRPLQERFDEIVRQGEAVASNILSEILGDAFMYKTSDIHFEPQETEVLLRFRIDGVLREILRIPLNYYENIVNRIKVASDLRIDEHSTAQDGSVQYHEGDSAVDMRVSIIPTIHGEKIVFRLLSQYIQSLHFSDLGFSSEHQEILEAVVKKPFGQILVTGPTGSGKSTTLYSILKYLQSPEINITTIEDPVEYKIPGVNQTQVNTHTNMTFANGLRYIVRQDPDIILVGEIRDHETAEIAINAALTGHLLLSTFHANTGATAIPRLVDMGVEPYLLSSTLELIVAQRLVRKICPQCRVTDSVSVLDLLKKYPYLKSFLTSKKTLSLFRGKGCVACKGSGYKGRTGVFEMIVLDDDIKSLILKLPSAKEIWAVARKNGAKSMFEDGLEKIKNGVTTFEELLRVVEPY